MGNFNHFSSTVEAVALGESPELKTQVDGHDIRLHAMPYGYFLAGQIPCEWDGTEQSLQAHLRLSMVIFNNFDFSVSAERETNTLHLSYYLAKPKKTDDLISAIEALTNLLDVWPAMIAKY